MRRFLLLPTATLLCCGFSSSVAAQNSLTVSQAPTPAPQLYLAQDSDSSQSSLGLEEAESSVDSPAKESPFNLFSDEPNGSLAEESVTGSDDLADNGTSEGTTPVGRRHRGLSPADTILSGAAALSNNSNYFPPIDWASQQRRAPNHTAEHMLQQWCADGLWDNYAAERAAQCAQQARLIAGKHHCGHCGHAGQMGAACCPPQPICEPIGGRQLGHCGHCDQAANSVHPADRPGSQVVGSAKGSRYPAQSQVAQSQSSQAQRYTPVNQHPQARNYQQIQASQYAQAPQQVGPNGRPMPAQMLPAQEEPAAMTNSTPGKVALQPLNFNR